MITLFKSETISGSNSLKELFLRQTQRLEMNQKILPVIVPILLLAGITGYSQQFVSVRFVTEQIKPDEYADVIIHTHIPNLDCTTENILVFAACGAISLEVYYGAWIWPGDCYRTDTINVGPFCEGLTYFSIDMYFPDFVKTDSYDTIISVETVTRTHISESDEFLVYPNPFNETIHVINTLHTKESIEFTVSDLSGRVMDSRILNFNNEMHAFNYPELSKGTYVYSITSQGRRLSTGLLVKTR